MEKTIVRCGWVKDQSLIYKQYHDKEWGRPLDFSNKRLFEFITLEGAQAGLSWITILKRREAYRKAFLEYDFYKLAQLKESELNQIYQNKDIIRNKLKINSVQINSRAFIKIIEEFGMFKKYLDTFTSGDIIVNNWENIEQIPTKTPLSDAISQDMKNRGFKFFGSVICYSFLQAIGIVNDHISSCSFKH